MLKPDFRIKMRSEERVYRLGVDGVFVWEAPESVDPDTAVKLTIHYPTGAPVEVDLVPMVSKTIAIDSIANNRELTPVDAGDLDELAGAIGHFGSGFLDLEAHGVHHVHVAGVVDGKIRLADFPSRSLNGDVTGTLTMAVRSGTIPALETTAVDVAWDVEDFDSGTLSWVPRPFRTGLTHAVLARRKPGIASEVNGAFEDYGSFIIAAEQELIGEIRNRLRGSGLREHDLLAGTPGLLEAHAELVMAHMNEGDAEAAEVYRARAFGALNIRGVRTGGMLDGALASVVTDSDGDGVSEARAQRAGQSRTNMGNFAQLARTRTRRYH